MKNQNLQAAIKKLTKIAKNCESLNVHIFFTDEYGKTIPSKNYLSKYSIVIPEFFMWNKADRAFLNNISHNGNYQEIKANSKHNSIYFKNLYTQLNGLKKDIYTINIGETWFDASWENKDLNFEIFWSDKDKSYYNGGKFDGLDDSSEAIKYRENINEKFSTITKYHLLNNLADVIEIVQKSESSPISIIMIFDNSYEYLKKLLADCNIKVTSEINSLTKEYDLLFKKSRGAYKLIRHTVIKKFIEKSSDENIENRTDLYKKYKKLLTKKYINKVIDLNLPHSEFLLTLTKKLES